MLMALLPVGALFSKVTKPSYLKIGRACKAAAHVTSISLALSIHEPSLADNSPFNLLILHIHRIKLRTP